MESPGKGLFPGFVQAEQVRGALWHLDSLLGKTS